MAEKYTAQYWRTRAEEVWTLVEDMHDETTRNMMLDIVADYERMAEMVETWEPDEGASSS